LRACIDDLLDDGEQVKGAAGEAVNPRHRHHVAGSEGLEHFEKLAPVIFVGSIVGFGATTPVRIAPTDLKGIDYTATIAGLSLDLGIAWKKTSAKGNESPARSTDSALPFFGSDAVVKRATASSPPLAKRRLSVLRD
jgi:hypothetical protein